MTPHEEEQWVDAYADGALDAPTAAAFERHLETCAACTARLGEIRAVSEALQSAPYFKAPDRLRQRLAPTPMPVPVAVSAPSPSRTAWLPWSIALAASLITAVAIARPISFGPKDDVASAIVESHVRSLMANHLVDVESTDRHTVKPWFAGRIDFSPTVVDLADAGFPLVGGRMDFVDGHQAAALIYKRREHSINVFVWPGGATSDITHAPDDPRGYHLRHWGQGGMTWWVISDLASAELDDFATRLRAAIGS